MQKIGNWIFVILMALYPVGVYFGLLYFDLKAIAIILMAVFVLRAFVTRKVLDKHNLMLALSASLVGISLSGISYLTDSELSIKLYPVIISLVFFTVFAISLVKPPSMIEKFARIQEPELSQEGVIYTRKVTQIWCFFFLLNASISLAITLKGSMQLWTLYNGLISYVLMGSLFIGEWLYRTYKLKKS